MKDEKEIAYANARIDKDMYRRLLGILAVRGQKYQHWLEEQIERELAAYDNMRPEAVHERDTRTS